MSTHVEKGDVLGSSQFRAHARRGENGHQQQKLQSQVLQLFWKPCVCARVSVCLCGVPYRHWLQRNRET